MYKMWGYTFYCFFSYFSAGIFILWFQIMYGVIGPALVFHLYTKPWADEHLYFTSGRYDRESFIKYLEAVLFKGESSGIICFSPVLDAEDFIDICSLLQRYEKERTLCRVTHNRSIRPFTCIIDCTMKGIFHVSAKPFIRSGIDLDRLPGAELTLVGAAFFSLT